MQNLLNRYNPLIMNMQDDDHKLLSLWDTFQKVMFVPLHPAGRPFVFGGGAVTVLLLLVWPVAGLLALLPTLFCVYFFRDPVRVTPQREGLVVAPADGRVIAVETGCALPSELAEEDADENYTRVSIFLSAVDVHVNRVPVSGEVRKCAYFPGRFLNAELDKASEENERAAALIGLEDGRSVCVVQIAGFIARRIVTALEPGQSVQTGERFGIIRFGSRVDLYLPGEVAPLVCVGQRCVGGETVMADLASAEKMRQGKAW